MNLIYVNELGPNYKGDNIYEFIFSDTLEVWGEDWDISPAAGRPLPPNVEYIRKVGTLKNSDIELDLIQNSDLFCVYDSVEGVISLAWEKSDSDHVIDDNHTRLVFRFGEEIDSVSDKLYERDVVLSYNENLINHEN
ncbi:hypothetical protein EB155_06890 [archaeon]|jgi:hypothetical protein|nr:hypothetical protein [archaeon]